MGIRMATKVDEIQVAINAEIERIKTLTIRALAYLGEKCVIEARDRSPEESWFDQTGNLRSSVGYVISYDGKIVQYSEFRQVKDGSEGKKTGKEFAEELVRKYSNKYVLVVVAGMNYAEYVEAMDNKVVLASAELFSREELPKMMRKLKKQIAK